MLPALVARSHFALLDVVHDARGDVLGIDLLQFDPGELFRGLHPGSQGSHAADRRYRRRRHAHAQAIGRLRAHESRCGNKIRKAAAGTVSAARRGRVTANDWPDARPLASERAAADHLRIGRTARQARKWVGRRQIREDKDAVLGQERRRIQAGGHVAPGHPLHVKGIGAYFLE